MVVRGQCGVSIMADVSSDASESEETERPAISHAATATEFLGSVPQPNFIPMSASAVFDAFLKLNRLQKPKMIESPLEDVMNPTWMKTDHLFIPPRIGMISSVVTPPMTSPAAPDQNHWSNLAAQH